MQVSRRNLLLASASIPLIAGLNLPATRAFAGVSPRDVEVNPSSAYSNIRALQFLLCAYGITTDTDGIYGPATTESVKKFQTARHLSATGTADAPTMKSMISGSNVAVGVNWPNHNTVMAVQQLLTKIGQTVPVDGTFTTTDVQRMNAFQASRGLPKTQAMDYLTWSWLFSPDIEHNIRKGAIIHVPQYSSLVSWEHDCGPTSLVMLQLRLGMTPGRWTNVANRADAISYARHTVLGLTNNNAGIGDVNHVDPILNPMRSVLHLNAKPTTTAQACAALQDGGVAMIAGLLDVANSWQGRTTHNGIHHWVTILDYNPTTQKYAIEDPAFVENQLVWVTASQLATFTNATSTSTTSISVTS